MNMQLVCIYYKTVMTTLVSAVTRHHFEARTVVCVVTAAALSIPESKLKIS